MSNRVYIIPFLLLLTSCHRQNTPEDPTVWGKIKIDFKRLDAEGLAGPEGGKGALNYEFCIPADEKSWKKVHRIDPTANKMAGSKGRSGCTAEQWLVIGSTHQKNYQRVLYELAALPYVKRIEETFWE